ncbi:MAG: macro domain-containing protein [Gemmatimonadetes bacterium]|nr:macro domain-containing protein [Gemmatimonadota bacterium]
MLRFVEGDILLTDAQVIAHGIAPNDDFKQGLALALRERWPAMVKDFRHYCHTDKPEAGEAWMWGAVGGLRIVNLLTQDAADAPGGRPGRAQPQHVHHALRALREMAQREQFESIALPRLATGVGGMEWEEVLPEIRRTLGDLGIPIIVYTTYVRGTKANEGLPARAHA